MSEKDDSTRLVNTPDDTANENTQIVEDGDTPTQILEEDTPTQILEEDTPTQILEEEVPPTPPTYTVEEIDDESTPAPKKSKAWLWWLVALVLIAGGGAAAYFLYFNKSGLARDNSSDDGTSDAEYRNVNNLVDSIDHYDAPYNYYNSYDTVTYYSVDSAVVEDYYGYGYAEPDYNYDYVEPVQYEYDY